MKKPFIIAALSLIGMVLANVGAYTNNAWLAVPAIVMLPIFIKTINSSTKL